MKLSSPSFSLVQDPPASGRVNMDLDSSLASSATIPTLRTYSWLEPTVSMGYFSDPVLASALAAGRPLVRRPTGGGLVEHASFTDPTDHTYCLVIPRCHQASRWPSSRLYHLIHEAMVCALAPQFPTLRLASLIDFPTSPSCFSSPRCFDVMLDRKKVAGAAQRRSRTALLHQGAIQTIIVPNHFWVDFGDLLANLLSSKLESVEAGNGESLVPHSS